MDWFVGDWTALPEVAAKAASMVVVAVIGLRLARRRTLAQWSVVDVVAAVSVGAVVGRTAIASSQSFLTGAVALLTILVVHRIASSARLTAVGRRVLDHGVRVLLVDGQLRVRECRRCGLSRADVEEQLRLRGVLDPATVRYLLFEAKGGFTVVHVGEEQAPLVRRVLDGAAGTRHDEPGRSAR